MITCPDDEKSAKEESFAVRGQKRKYNPTGTKHIVPISIEYEV